MNRKETVKAFSDVVNTYEKAMSDFIKATRPANHKLEEIRRYGEIDTLSPEEDTALYHFDYHFKNFDENFFDFVAVVAHIKEQTDDFISE